MEAGVGAECAGSNHSCVFGLVRTELCRLNFSGSCDENGVWIVLQST